MSIEKASCNLKKTKNSTIVSHTLLQSEMKVRCYWVPNGKLFACRNLKSASKQESLSYVPTVSVNFQSWSRFSFAASLKPRAIT